MRWHRHIWCPFKNRDTAWEDSHRSLEHSSITPTKNCKKTRLWPSHVRIRLSPGRLREIYRWQDRWECWREGCRKTCLVSACGGEYIFLWKNFLADFGPRSPELDFSITRVFYSPSAAVFSVGPTRVFKISDGKILCTGGFEKFHIIYKLQTNLLPRRSSSILRCFSLLAFVRPR